MLSLLLVWLTAEVIVSATEFGAGCIVAAAVVARWAWRRWVRG